MRTVAELKVIVAKAIKKTPMTHGEVCDRYKCTQRTATLVLSALVREGKAYRQRKTGNGTLYADYPAETVAESILRVMGDKQWSANELSDFIGATYSAVNTALFDLERRGRVTKTPYQKRFWRWNLAQDVCDAFVPEADDGLKDLMANAWRGTPWQGMECVL